MMVKPPKQKDTVFKVVKSLPLGTVFVLEDIIDRVNKNHRRWEITVHELPRLLYANPYCKAIYSDKRKEPIRYVRIEPNYCPSCGEAMSVMDGFGLWCARCRIKEKIPEATA